jgi:hypothetical protein
LHAQIRLFGSHRAKKEEKAVGSKKRSKERAVPSVIRDDGDAGLELGAPSKNEPEDRALPAPGAHPEEMRGTVELRITDHVTLRASARATPAGLVGAAILLSAILVPAMLRRRYR